MRRSVENCLTESIPQQRAKGQPLEARLKLACFLFPEPGGPLEYSAHQYFLVPHCTPRPPCRLHSPVMLAQPLLTQTDLPAPTETSLWNDSRYYSPLRRVEISHRMPTRSHLTPPTTLRIVLLLGTGLQVTSQMILKAIRDPGRRNQNSLPLERQSFQWRFSPKPSSFAQLALLFLHQSQTLIPITCNCPVSRLCPDILTLGSRDLQAPQTCIFTSSNSGQMPGLLATCKCGSFFSTWTQELAVGMDLPSSLPCTPCSFQP